MPNDVIAILLSPNIESPLPTYGKKRIVRGRTRQNSQIMIWVTLFHSTRRRHKPPPCAKIFDRNLYHIFSMVFKLWLAVITVSLDTKKPTPAGFWLRSNNNTLECLTDSICRGGSTWWESSTSCSKYAIRWTRIGSPPVWAILQKDANEMERWRVRQEIELISKQRCWSDRHEGVITHPVVVVVEGGQWEYFGSQWWGRRIFSSLLKWWQLASQLCNPQSLPPETWFYLRESSWVREVMTRQDEWNKETKMNEWEQTSTTLLFFFFLDWRLTFFEVGLLTE